MYVPEIKQKAIDLRKQGYSYNYIIQYVPVSKSTLSDWLQNIPFVPNKHTIKTIRNARIASGSYKHSVKIKSLEEAESKAQKYIGTLSKRDVIMLGLGIYIGEGGKTVDITKITNSDPRIIKFSIQWLRVLFGVEVKNIRIRLHLYPDNNENTCINYWSKQTEIPRSCFYPSSIDKRIDKKINNKGKLPFGTAHVSVKGFRDKKFGVNLHRLIMALINRVLC